MGVIFTSTSKFKILQHDTDMQFDVQLKKNSLYKTSFFRVINIPVLFHFGRKLILASSLFTPPPQKHMQYTKSCNFIHLHRVKLKADV